MYIVIHAVVILCMTILVSVVTRFIADMPNMEERHAAELVKLSLNSVDLAAQPQNSFSESLQHLAAAQAYLHATRILVPFHVLERKISTDTLRLERLIARRTQRVLAAAGSTSTISSTQQAATKKQC